MAGTLKLHHGVPRARREVPGGVTFNAPPRGEFYNPDDVIRREYRALRRLGVPASSARASVLCLLMAGETMGRAA
jgi:hypothetical protein